MRRQHPGLKRSGPGIGLAGLAFAAAAANARKAKEEREREDYARSHGDHKVPRRKQQ